MYIISRYCFAQIYSESATVAEETKAGALPSTETASDTAIEDATKANGGCLPSLEMGTTEAIKSDGKALPTADETDVDMESISDDGMFGNF